MTYKNAQQFLTTPSGIVAVLAFGTLAVSGALLAHAAETPSVTTEVRNGSNTAVVSAAIGTSVHDHIVVAAATTSDPVPAGTVDITRYQGTTCTGTSTTEAGIALVSGVADSATTTVPANGLSYKVHYNGQTDVYPATDGTCEAVTATSGSVSIATTLSSTTIATSSSAYDTATLSGVTANAGGTLSYKAFSDSACSVQARDAGTKTVTNGTVPNSNALTFDTAGTFYWQAVYSGDANNASATSTCADEALHVVAGTPAPSTGNGSIHGTFYNDVNKNDSQDNGEVGISGFTVWLHQVPDGQSHTLKHGYGDPIIMTGTTDSNGAYTFSNLASGSYFLEEKTMAGWHQNDGDRFVTVTNDATAVANFSNFAIGSSTGNGNGHNHDGEGDNNEDDSGSDHSNNGNHFGWFRDHFNFGFHFGQVKKAIGNGKHNDD